MATASRQHLPHALNFVCSSLHVLGVTGLTPETIRQAKSGGPVVRLPIVMITSLWRAQSNVLALCGMKAEIFERALQDLVVLSLAGFPDSAHTSLQDFWSQVDYVPQGLRLPAEGVIALRTYLYSCHVPLLLTVRMYAGQQLVSVYLQQLGYARASFYLADAHSDSR